MNTRAMPLNLRCLILLMALSVWIPSAWATDDTPAPKRLLYINSYHHGYAWSDEIERGLRERLAASGHIIELSVEYLDSRRFSYLSHQEALAASMAIKYADYHQDLILTSDNAAFEFAVRHRERLAPDRPIVFCGYNNLRPDDLAGIPAITGVNEELDISGTVELALGLHPNVRHQASAWRPRFGWGYPGTLDSGDLHAPPILPQDPTPELMNTSTKRNHIRLCVYSSSMICRTISACSAA
jgi:hypothetical protein